MIQRVLKERVELELDDWPVVVLGGSQFSGKTTLASEMGGARYDLTKESERLRLDLEWEECVDAGSLIILDEIIACPKILERVRLTVDTNKKRPGQFLILTSVAPKQIPEMGKALPKRMKTLELSPMLINELPSLTLQDPWLKGGFRVDDGMEFPEWHRETLDLWTETMLPRWGFKGRPEIAKRLMKMLARVHGEPWNASQIAESLGLSYHTVNAYVEFLKDAYWVRLLPTYSGNIKKRLQKRPKLYWRDTGILHTLLTARDMETILAEPWVGSSWKGFVIEQILSFFSAKGIAHEASYFQTSDGYKLDLVLKLQRKTWAIQIKLTSQPGLDDFKKLEKTGEMIGANRCVLITQAKDSIVTDKRWACDLPAFLNKAEEELA